MPKPPHSGSRKKSPPRHRSDRPSDRRPRDGRDAGGRNRRFGDTRRPTPATSTPRPRLVRLEVMAEDDDLLVIDKPAGLPVAVEEPYDDCAIRHLAKHAPPGGMLRGFDALDAELSGVALIARNAGAETKLVKQVIDGQFTRVYHVLVRVAPLQTEGRIEMEIGRDVRGSHLMRVGGAKAKPALTEWKLLDRFAGFAVLECRTRGERRHQIRVHLHAAGMPLAVDAAYGSHTRLMLSSFKPKYTQSRRHDERPLIDRVSAHAFAIEFTHPATGEPVRHECPPPKDFRAALNQLDKHGRLPV